MKHQVVNCPSCGRALSASTLVSDHPPASPKPGDYTVCVYCFTILEFTDGGAVARGMHEVEEEYRPLLQDAFLAAEQWIKEHG